jgi:hypothetical protein
LIEDTKQHIVDANAERAKQKAEYEENMKAHDDVIAAIDEALELLNNLDEDGAGESSFAQIK